MQNKEKFKNNKNMKWQTRDDARQLTCNFKLTNPTGCAISRVCHLQAQNGAHLDSIFVIDMHFSLYLAGLDFFENIYLRNIPT